MDAFISRKRQRSSPPTENTVGVATDEDDTDLKIATLASLYPALDQGVILEALLASDGSVELAIDLINTDNGAVSPRKRSKPNGAVGYQSSLISFNIKPSSTVAPGVQKSLTKKGQTLHLYSPDDIAAYTPCSIIHNFLPQEEANAILLELLEEAPTFSREKFKLFDRVVQSPHTSCFYVDNSYEAEKQKVEYFYNGGRVKDVRESLPEMLKVRERVEKAVNQEIEKRIRDFYPSGKKLLFQDPDRWSPNAAFVNCYDGGSESVGYHSDQLTYLGPRAVIGSLSLGVAREFRVRKVVAEEDDNIDAEKPWTKSKDASRADTEGQISIHLPHNSLLVMHAEMQEEWKHSIAPATTIDPHPIAKNRRLNITYRCYKANLHPNFTPKCRCGIPTVLRCVQRRKGSKGRYMWMCYTGYTPDGKGCGFFQWAEFDEDGRPGWDERFRGNKNIVTKDEVKQDKEADDSKLRTN